MSDSARQTDRLSAALSGRYRIERELGAGGMATVYLAFDEKHDRKVAIKVLKPELAAVLGAERFVVEIKTTASMSHPHILPLFDSGTADGFLFYVMPYIQGETIREKLNRETQFGVDEAVRIAREIADALDYAHRHGVIHRDIKPENLLLHDGRAMVMDFGIALAVSAAAGGRMTETGLSLGTPHYMSPEQATAEKEITARSDQYSLASVLYEMLSGQPPHVGGAAQQVIMKIITEQAQPVSAIRKSVPANVDAALSKALEKLPADRFDSAKTFADALANASFTTVGTDARGMAGRHRSGVSLRALIATAVLAIAATASVTWWIATRDSEPTSAVRFAFATYPAEPIAMTVGRNLALSPDGKTLAFATRDSTGTLRLFLRALDDVRARAVPGTEGAESPFFAPGGQVIGYTVNRRQIRWIPVEGGSATVLGDFEMIRGASWGPDGIVVSTNGRIMLVPSSGGTPVPVIPGDSARGYWPIVLPGGKAVVYGHYNAVDGDLEIADRAKSRTVKVGVAGMVPVGVASGNLIFVRADGALMAVPFDQDALRVAGDARVVVSEVAINAASGEAKVALSESGVLTYVAGVDLYRPAIVDLQGNARPLPVPPGRFSDLRYSPNGQRYATSVQSTARSDIYVYDVASGASRRLTFDGTLNGRPEWSADGTRVLYRTNRGSALTELWWQPVDGTGAAERLLATPGKDVWQGELVERDSALIYRTGSLGDADIFYRRLKGDTIDKPIANTNFTEQAATASPDGLWIAYQSDESGRYEVYVRPFAGTGAPIPVSIGGGQLPRWSRNGNTIFFVNGIQFFAAAVSTRPTFTVGARSQLFADNYLVGAGHAAYDVTIDGKGLLLLQPIVGGGEQVIVVHNWAAELRAGARAANQ